MDLSKILDTSPQLNIVKDAVKNVNVENTSGDYWLPATMSPEQREVYNQVVSLHYSDILRYFSESQQEGTKDFVFSEDVIHHSMDTMLFNLETVSLHPHLLLTHNIPRSLTTKDTSANLCNQSGKFRALGDLINLINKYETNTAIICKGDVNIEDWSFGQHSFTRNLGKKSNAPSSNGSSNDNNKESSNTNTDNSTSTNNNNGNGSRMCDLLEALLIGFKVNVRRHDGKKSIKKGSKDSDSKENSVTDQDSEETPGVNTSSKLNNKKNPCTVHIFSESNLEKVYKDLDKSIYFDLLISVDSSLPINVTQNLNKYPGIKKILTLNRSTPAPIIRISSIYSVDHAAFFFQSKWPNYKHEGVLIRENKVLKNVVAASVVLRNQVGILTPALKPVYDGHLEYLSEWIAAPDMPWPLPEVYPISEFNRLDVERSLITEFHDENTSSPGKNDFSKTGAKPLGLFSSSMYAGINPGSKDMFYQSNRCKNKYRSNPELQKNMSSLTGISNTTEKYHLQCDFATHELIYALSSAHRALKLQKRSLDVYQNYDQKIEGVLDFLKKEYDTLNQKVVAAEKKLKDDELTVSRFLKVQESTRVKIENVDQDKIPKVALLKKELEKLKKSSELKKSEREYMATEIGKAQKTVEDNDVQIAAMKLEIEATSMKINETTEQDQQDSKRMRDECVQLDTQIDDYKKYKTQVEEELTSLNKIVKELPIKRSIRSQSSRRRHRA